MPTARQKFKTSQNKQRSKPAPAPLKKEQKQAQQRKQPEQPPGDAPEAFDAPAHGEL